MTLNEFMQGNKSAGLHYFDRDTMWFFRSRIVRNSWASDGYFITSEQFDDNTPRKYSIRKGDLSSFSVASVGEFQAYATLRDARKALNAIRQEALALA